MIDVRSVRQLLAELLHAAAVALCPCPEEVPERPHRKANGMTCWCGVEHWRSRTVWRRPDGAA